MLGKHRLEPNEKTELKVTYTTEGNPGIFRKSVTLSTDIPGQKDIQIFKMNGTVLEAPAAKIAVEPRRIKLEGIKPGGVKNQAISVANEGTLPLVIKSIHSRDGKIVYFDGSKEGNLVIDPSQTKTIDLQLTYNSENKTGRDLIIIDSNAKNAGKTGYFLIVQYGAP